MRAIHLSKDMGLKNMGSNEMAGADFTFPAEEKWTTQINRVVTSEFKIQFGVQHLLRHPHAVERFRLRVRRRFPHVFDKVESLPVHFQLKRFAAMFFW